jgi:hypothetical protein
VGTTINSQPSVPSHKPQAPVSAALVELVRLLARQVAQEAVTQSQSTASSADADSELEDTCEAEV